ncbi:hypothetical protein CVT25_000049 [Psilocybe cyanescens]|uniref:Uncharacterized protein n=1 Tax=Psilocybe cyanescens TaxID=93625 RepID=A0A409X8G0_PSICY|nr:hypothetical protein CVT25_000049 [Psilocybe cyanescens]
MSRGKKKAAHHLAPPPPVSHKFCTYCQVHRVARSFSKHQKACKQIWQIDHEARGVNRTLGTSSSGENHKNEAEDEIAMMDIEPPSEIENLNIGGYSSLRENDSPDQLLIDEQYGPSLPEIFLKVIPHPKSMIQESLIIPLIGNSMHQIKDSSAPYVPQPQERPWAPFRTLEDFEVTEVAIASLMPRNVVNKFLTGITGNWSDSKSPVTLKKYSDMDAALLQARKYIVQFKCEEVSAEFDGKVYNFKFQYRDPWDYISSLVNDESLMSVHMWNSVKKYYCEGDFEEQIFDEPNTAETWWNVDSELPEPDPYPHCYVPLHFWLDKGMVTRHVKKYPMVIRAAWLPRNIRNASGNGGGLLVGYMPIVPDPGDRDERTANESLEFAHFKRVVYQKVASRVFSSLRRRSHSGEARQCGDAVNRVLHPGILIESHDGEEANIFCACRASGRANYPCPKCLVHKDQLNNIIGNFEARTSDSMRSVIRRTLQASTKTEKENILQGFGLHDIQHFLWDFRFSDPYAASSYDTLHSDDLGKWGKHLWDLLLIVLEACGKKGELTRNMALFPRWSNLKHFSNVSTTTFGDGQAFYDILKCILPCIVQLLPRNSIFVKCIRTYQRYRLMIGLTCMSERRLQRLSGIIEKYQDEFLQLCNSYKKNPNFPKQHAVNHVVAEIRAKGTTDNYSTRMARIDEKQEAIARIRMAIDNDIAARAKIKAEAETNNDDFKADSQPNLVQSVWAAPENIDGQSPHWKFGSPEKPINSRALETEMPTLCNLSFKEFDDRLRDFLSLCLPTEVIRYEDPIVIRLYKCVSVKYQSLEDWTESCDILRCNRQFHGQERYDCILSESKSSALQFSRLKALLRCKPPSGRLLDVALVQKFTAYGKWKPNTIWDGCKVFKENACPSFLLMDEVVRGALLAPAFGSGENALYYFMDIVDGDMYLRAGN